MRQAVYHKQKYQRREQIKPVSEIRYMAKLWGKFKKDEYVVYTDFCNHYQRNQIGRIPGRGIHKVFPLPEEIAERNTINQ